MENGPIASRLKKILIIPDLVLHDIMNQPPDILETILLNPVPDLVYLHSWNILYLLINCLNLWLILVDDCLPPWNCLQAIRPWFGWR